MAKWQSKAQVAEQEYQSFYRQTYPQLEEAMKQFVASYDDSQPVEDDMKTLSPVALLRRRMTKYCVWPLVARTSASVSFQSRIVTESVERFAKPMQDAYTAKKRADEQAKHEALKVRQIVEKGMYRQSYAPGAFVMLPESNRVLVCISCEDVLATKDMGQFDSGYYITFA